MTNKEKSTSWQQTWILKNRNLLEFVYGDKIQNIARIALNKMVADVSVEKQQDYAKWAQSEANKQ